MIQYRKVIRAFLIICFFFFVNITIQAQDRFITLEGKLNSLAKDFPGLDSKVQLSVNGTSIQEFLRGIALSSNLNINVDPSLKISVVNTFTNASVTDVLMFLCRQYNLDINFIGSIMSVVQYQAPPEKPKVVESKKLSIDYDAGKDELSMDLKNDSLYAVVKEITRKSDKNVLVSQELGNTLVSGYVQKTPFKNALDLLAFSNNLKVTATTGDVYFIEKRDAGTTLVNSGTKKEKGSRTKATEGLKIEMKNSLLTVDANNVPIADVLAEASGELNKDYFLFNEPKGNATLTVKDQNFDSFLNYLLNGTDYTYKKEGEIYLIGDRNLEKLRSTKVIQLKFRTIDKVMDLIPADLKKGVEIKTFMDLNSFIISGATPRIEELERFLKDIDRVVPNISIEILVVDVSDSKSLTTQLDAGLKKDVKTSGTVSPGLDMTLSSQSVNDVITGINGIGSVVLGKVTPDFYVHLKLLEEQGKLKTRSTPILATLNGHEATLSIGRTEYYLEISNSVVGNVAATVTTQQNYKSVNADLSVKINPMVSGDDQITLEINVKQSNFTARIAPTAPPGTVTRDFKSMVRVKNEEMILLGGLEEDSMNDAGSGLPWLSRIPVIKWFFSSRTKAKKKSKLTIFIKPTVIYN